MTDEYVRLESDFFDPIDNFYGDFAISGITGIGGNTKECDEIKKKLKALDGARVRIIITKIGESR